MKFCIELEVPAEAVEMIEEEVDIYDWVRTCCEYAFDQTPMDEYTGATFDVRPGE